MILSSFPPHGRNISLDSGKSLSDSGTLISSWGPRNVPLPQKRSAIWVIGSRRKASCQTLRSSQPLGRFHPPKKPLKVRSFLGLASYYRRYVKNFAAIAGPLHALTRKDAVFHWSADFQTAFDRLKTLLITSPITAFLDFSQAFRLYTDASTAGIGAILAQVRDGNERIICCASRSLNQAEKAYPATKLECLAIVWAVAKFRPYLMAMPFRGLHRPLRAANG